jgi:TonB family protein
MRRVLILLFVVSCCLGPTAISQSQQPSSDSRKIVHKVMPTYPEIAKRMQLSGSVKIMATVGPDGSVKTTQPMGGSPVLLQAAQDAVSKWKFASTSAETRELIELHFDPQ